MGYNELMKECVKARDDLVSALRASDFHEKLKSEIDKFEVKTTNYLETSARYQARVKKVCGNELIEERVLKSSLVQFKSLINESMNEMKPYFIPPPIDFDSSNHTHIEKMNMWKEKEVETTKNNLENIVNILDTNSRLIFGHVELVAKRNLTGMHSGRYIH